MDKKQYQERLGRGIEILETLMPELNKISDQHIRKNDNNVFRREEDLREIAVALALYDDRIQACLV